MNVYEQKLYKRCDKIKDNKSKKTLKEFWEEFQCGGKFYYKNHRTG